LAEISKELVLAKAHEVRNVAEYEGHFDVDETVLRNLIDAAEAVRAAVAALPALPESGADDGARRTQDRPGPHPALCAGDRLDLCAAR
jgi:hypothetical protein